MNRKTFLGSLAGLIAAPKLFKTDILNEAVSVKEPVCAAKDGKIIGVFYTRKDESIVAACNRIRKEAEELAGHNYAFRQGRITGMQDFLNG